MEPYEQIKEQILNGEAIKPSFLSLQVAFELFKLDLAQEILNNPGVVEEVINNLDNLQDQDNFLGFLVNQLPFSELYKEIKQRYLHKELVWENVVSLEKIPLKVSGIYLTADNQAVVKSDKLHIVDIILENKEHPIISSLNKLGVKESFKFVATLQKGSLYTYTGNIEVEQLDQKIAEIKEQEIKELEPFSKYRNWTKSLSAVALSLAMAVSVVGCGRNPDVSGATEPPPYNNSPDCQIERARFYDKLSTLRPGMSEEEVGNILDPEWRLRTGNFKYSISYEIMGFDYSQNSVVTCEAVQIHFDSYWRYRTFTVHTYPL